MSVGKVFEFPSKPEQLGLSSSIRLEVTMKHDTCKYDQFNWCSLTPAKFPSLYSLMPRRMTAVITAEGGVTKY